jgi:hypothetical protein
VAPTIMIEAKIEVFSNTIYLLMLRSAPENVDANACRSSRTCRTGQIETTFSFDTMND